MSTIHKQGPSIDITFNAGANLRTSTAQYMVVGMVGGTTTAVDYTVEGAFNSATIGTATSTTRHALGVNLSMMSANSTKCVVRVLGVSKVICGDSITAGDWLKSATGTPTSTLYGTVMAIDDGQTAGSGGYLTATTHTVVLGRAFESGSTGTVISALINPQMYEFSMMPTST